MIEFLENIFVQQVLYRGSYVLLFFLLYRLIRLLIRWRVFPFLLLAGASFLFVWMRFWEPQQIDVVSETIDIDVNQRVVFISDLHLWVYKDRVYLQKVVNRINRLRNVDYVLIAWDLTYDPLPTQDLKELFQPLGDLHVPVYAVLWNHDVQKPGPDIRRALVEAIESHGVVFLHNDIIELPKFLLVGLWPRMSNEDNISLLERLHPLNKVVVLTHNPDTVDRYTTHNADVTLVGHTHCGQVRVPWLHPYLRAYTYPVEGDWDCGLYRTPYTRLYISPWLGEVMLPIRFRNKPTVTVIDLAR